MKNFRKTIDSANINFLIGAGASAPFLGILGAVETELDNAKGNTDEVIKIKRKYVEKSMIGNLDIIDNSDNVEKENVLANYKKFYKTINTILLNRESSILTKQVNIFTTNIDIFSEKALEETNIEFNDGFHGRFTHRYDLGNFKKSYFKKSLHYENTSEIPVFNILKLHGSLSWKKKNEKNDIDDDEIILDRDLSLLRNFSVNEDEVCETTTEVTDSVHGGLLEKIVNLIKKRHVVGFLLPGSSEDANKIATPKENTDSLFNTNYDKLRLVNPTRDKFNETVLGNRYYDLIRTYTNELEKDRTVLFVIGFSFADKHIKDLTIRAVNANPTLKVYIFSHGDAENSTYISMKGEAKNSNIEILYPKDYSLGNFDLKTITQIFESKILNSGNHEDKGE